MLFSSQFTQDELKDYILFDLHAIGNAAASVLISLKDGGITIIEDDDVARQLACWMHKQGVPMVSDVSDIPSRPHRIQPRQTVDDTMIPEFDDGH